MELKGIKLKGAYKIKNYAKSLEVYDEKGNRIYYEEKNGYWEKWEYDKKGNMTYYEISGGYWQKREYDEKGNEIYYESSQGRWAKREYDKKGNLIYYRNNDSEIIDNRVRELTIEQIENLLGYNIKIEK